MSATEIFDLSSWAEGISTATQTDAVTALEKGQLLLFPQLPFLLEPAELRFLSPAFVDNKSKNISFDSTRGRLAGAVASHDELRQLRYLVSRFTRQATTLIQQLFPAYRRELQIARTSFRPVQVSQRKMSYRKDDRLLHVDAFPANPIQGRRILRVFSNINPYQEDRVWRIGEPFEAVARHFLPTILRPWPGARRFLQWLGITRSYRTEYDHIMLQLHDHMKKDSSYQIQAPQTTLRLPPGSTWIVQTDQVSHAAMSGQHMLEQTFYLPVEAMVNPALSPLRVLERLSGRQLI